MANALINKSVNALFDPRGSGYDFAGAKAAGIGPDKGYNHPTFYKTIAADEGLGYRLVEGPDGRFYSIKMDMPRYTTMANPHR
jgi:hypothetical protein